MEDRRSRRLSLYISSIDTRTLAGRKESRGRIRFQKRKLEREEEDNYCSTGREKEEWRVGGVTKRSYNAYTANFGSLA